jgi:hypothetical protein
VRLARLIRGAALAGTRRQPGRLVQGLTRGAALIAIGLSAALLAQHILGFELPLDRPDLPAAMGARGEAGVREGVDYRGVPVLAAVQAVPDSPWFLVAKVDQAEIYAPIRAQVRAVTIALATMALAVALGVGLLWRQRAAETLAREVAASRILTATATSLDLQAVLDCALRGAMELTDMEGGTLCMVDSERQTLELAAHVNTSPEIIRELTTNIIKIGDCLCGHCAQTGEPLILWDNASGGCSGYPARSSPSKVVSINYFRRLCSLAVVSTLDSYTPKMIASCDHV